MRSVRQALNDTDTGCCDLKKHHPLKSSFYQLASYCTILTIDQHVQLYIYVTKFAKRGLIHAFKFLTLRMCNSASVGPTTLKFCSKTFLVLYL